MDAAAEIGSNMWAFAPSRSQSGRAILMGNPHQPWAPVSTYYEAHMIVPGKLNFYGSTFIGRPILTSGWNEHLGWSHTVNYPDLEEIYELDARSRAAGPLPVRRRFGAACARRRHDQDQATASQSRKRARSGTRRWDRSSIATPAKCSCCAAPATRTIGPTSSGCG